MNYGLEKRLPRYVTLRAPVSSGGVNCSWALGGSAGRWEEELGAQLASSSSTQLPAPSAFGLQSTTYNHSPVFCFCHTEKYLPSVCPEALKTQPTVNARSPLAAA